MDGSMMASMLPDLIGGVTASLNVDMKTVLGGVAQSGVIMGAHAGLTPLASDKFLRYVKGQPLTGELPPHGDVKIRGVSSRFTSYIAKHSSDLMEILKNVSDSILPDDKRGKNIVRALTSCAFRATKADKHLSRCPKDAMVIFAYLRRVEMETRALLEALRSHMMLHSVFGLAKLDDTIEDFVLSLQEEFDALIDFGKQRSLEWLSMAAQIHCDKVMARLQR